MIRLERYPQASYHPDFVDSRRHEIPSEFFTYYGQNSESYILLDGSEPIGLCAHWVQEDRVHFRFWFVSETSDDNKREAISMYTEKAIKTYHPERLLVHGSRADERIYNGCRFFQKGKLYQKIIEPWRYQVPDAAFDKDGYIINQGLLKALPFGWFDSMSKGCGWIAAYNILKMNGSECTMQECAESLGRRTLLGGLMGQESMMLLLWLRTKKLNAKMTVPSNRAALKAMREADNGILLYTHAHGAHYTAFRRLKNGELWFYNAVYGRASHIETPQSFLQKYALFPFSSVIYVKKEI